MDFKTGGLVGVCGACGSGVSLETLVNVWFFAFVYIVYNGTAGSGSIGVCIWCLKT